MTVGRSPELVTDIFFRWEFRMRPNQGVFPSSARRGMFTLIQWPVRFLYMLRLSIPQIPHGGCAIQQRFDASTRHTKRRGHRKSNRSSHVGNGYNGSFAHLLSLSNLRLRTASKSQQQRSIDAIPHKSRSYRTHESLPIVQRCWMKIERSFRRRIERSAKLFRTPVSVSAATGSRLRIE